MTMTTSPRPPREGTAAGSSRRRPATSPAERLGDFLERIDHPLTTYTMLMATTAALTVLGLIMVMSASSTRTYATFTKQAVYALIGVVLAAVASRLAPGTWKRFAVAAFGVAVVLQSLTLTPLGVNVNGNTNWVRIAGQQLQPSEFGKIALVLFGAYILDKKKKVLGDVLHVVVPFVFPAAAILLGLVLAGGDLGTSFVLLAIVAGILYAAGLQLRWFGVAALGGVAVVALMTVTSSNRTGRIGAWLGDSCTTNPDLCRQVNNGFYALADGGWLGRGLGQSLQKWGWLPESGNDFILAIIGEELGLAGTLVVLALYGALAYACLRLVVRSRDLFVRLASAGVMVWICAQAFINIGAVTGLLPVIGVPLPLISGGGTALISTLVACGMLMSFARYEPGAQAQLAARKHAPRRPARRPAQKVSRMPSTPRRSR